MTNRYFDNTRISEHRRCNRKYYFRHVRDWIRTGTRMPLIFGSAWHKAMETLWPMVNEKHYTDQEVIAASFKAFTDCWEAEGLPAWDDIPVDSEEKWNPRIPRVAMNMIAEYLSARAGFIESIELLGVEKPFAVPLHPDDDTLFYVGRMDKTIGWTGKVWGGEHKTTTLYKRDGFFRADFVEGFSPNSQIDGYLHALNMDYGNDAGGILVDAALVHKTVHEGFMFIPIERQWKLLDGWLWETLVEIERIKDNEEKLSALQSDQSMRAFPKNTGSCSDYGGCPYRDVCRSEDSPHLLTEPPLGFHEEHWEPFDILELNKIGMSPESA